jgi:hypothetical protein
VVSLFTYAGWANPQLVNEAKPAYPIKKTGPQTFQSIHKLKSSVNLLKIGILKEQHCRTGRTYHATRYKPIASLLFLKSSAKQVIQTVSLLKDEIIRLKKSS